MTRSKTLEKFSFPEDFEVQCIAGEWHTGSMIQCPQGHIRFSFLSNRSRKRPQEVVMGIQTANQYRGWDGVFEVTVVHGGR